MCARRAHHDRTQHHHHRNRHGHHGPAQQAHLRQVGPDAGLRTRLALDDVLPAAAMAFTPAQRPLLVQASMGHAEAQAELGQLFCLAGRHDLGAHWLQQAAGRGSADAMQWLALLHAQGEGVARDEAACLRWLRQAAGLGHVIARGQLAGWEPLAAGC
jgi:TPR repeat protein